MNIKLAITFVSFKKKQDMSAFFKNIKNIMVFGTVQFIGHLNFNTMVFSVPYKNSKNTMYPNRPLLRFKYTMIEFSGQLCTQDSGDHVNVTFLRMKPRQRTALRNSQAFPDSDTSSPYLSSTV
jgi:hypothetical protein